jgi:hypothetical protein
VGEEVVSNQVDKEGISDKFHLDFDHTAYNLNYLWFQESVYQLWVQKTCKIAVQSFVVANQFIAETEAQHQTMFLSQKMAQKDPQEYAFNDAFDKAGGSRVAPAWYGLDPPEEVRLPCRVLNVRVNEKGVCLPARCGSFWWAPGFRQCSSVAKLLLRFLLTMPSDAAKKGRTWEVTKRCSIGESLAQSVALAERSISLAA